MQASLSSTTATHHSILFSATCLPAMLIVNACEFFLLAKKMMICKQNDLSSTQVTHTHFLFTCLFFIRLICSCCFLCILFYFISFLKPNDERLSLSPMASELSSASPAIVASNIVPARERSANWSSESLLFDPNLCSSFDSITIFSGRNPGNSSSIISRFCSNGKLPVVITPISSTASSTSSSSQRDGMVIVFKSTRNSLLFDSRFQLSVQAIFIPSAVSSARLPSQASLTGADAPLPLYPFFMSPPHPFASSSAPTCDITIDAEQISSHSIEASESPIRRSGSLSLPLLNFHTSVTVNSTCSV